jgi:monoamine oxidase
VKVTLHVWRQAGPAARGRLELLGVHSWGTDPYAAGAWGYFRPGQVSRFAAGMGAPHGPVHFCGEQLAVSARGMEGAMESAEITARAILSA